MACPRNEAKYGKLVDAVTNEVPAAEMAPAVRAVAIVIYFRRRNVGPIVFAYLAGDPIAVL